MLGEVSLGEVRLGDVWFSGVSKGEVRFSEVRKDEIRLGHVSCPWFLVSVALRSAFDKPDAAYFSSGFATLEVFLG